MEDGLTYETEMMIAQASLVFVAHNAWALKERGIYEKCLLSAFMSPRTNHRDSSDEAIATLFDFADHQELRAAGDPLPGDGPFRLYRGVGGRGRARRLRGFSWTSSLDVACWFALRYPLAHPAVFTAEVAEADVLAYSNDRDEGEFFCRPDQIARLKIGIDEMTARAETRKASA